MLVTASQFATAVILREEREETVNILHDSCQENGRVFMNLLSTPP